MLKKIVKIKEQNLFISERLDEFRQNLWKKIFLENTFLEKP